jgi:hypothetical protein
VALIVPPVSAQYVTDQEESTIRSAFALNVAGRVRHSEEFTALNFTINFKNTTTELRLRFFMLTTFSARVNYSRV